MEVLQEVVVVGELKDPSQQIVKGKRTKRQRPTSPIPFNIASTHLSSGEGVSYNNNEENITGENNNYNNNDNNQNGNTNLRSSLAGSSDDDANSTTTEEEDVARLLILLSQGSSRESSTKNDYLDHNYYPPSTKFNSKKYIETSSHANGKVGMFVYECQTCNRTFSSFQALGGHRASHKKPKNLAIEEIKKGNGSSVFRYDYDYDFNPPSLSFSRNSSYSNLTSPISHHSTMNKYSTSSKVHECSYCGAEFTSGQALGGHMRRHRGSNGNNNSTYNYYYKKQMQNLQPLLSLSPSLKSPIPVNEESTGINKHDIDSNNNDALALSLSLDLNLPAPPAAENDQKNQESTTFEFDTEKISPPPSKPNEQQQTDINSPELFNVRLE